jgi:hypothetical protein
MLKFPVFLALTTGAFDRLTASVSNPIVFLPLFSSAPRRVAKGAAAAGAPCSAAEPSLKGLLVRPRVPKPIPAPPAVAAIVVTINPSPKPAAEPSLSGSLELQVWLVAGWTLPGNIAMPHRHGTIQQSSFRLLYPKGLQPCATKRRPALVSLAFRFPVTRRGSARCFPTGTVG